MIQNIYKRNDVKFEKKKNRLAVIPIKEEEENEEDQMSQGKWNQAYA